MKRFVAVVVLAVLAACGSSGPDIPKPPPSGERVDVSFGSHVIRAEIANDKVEWNYGLMNRDHLGTNAGMLFVFPQLLPATYGFYMYRTLIPLQIAYLQNLGGSTYRVVALKEMTPCHEGDPKKCPQYDPGNTYDAALEVNKGWLTRANVKVGDQASVAPATP